VLGAILGRTPFAVYPLSSLGFKNAAPMGVDIHDAYTLGSRAEPKDASYETYIMAHWLTMVFGNQQSPIITKTRMTARMKGICLCKSLRYERLGIRGFLLSTGLHMASMCI
jgi:hypothetical protein